MHKQINIILIAALVLLSAGCTTKTDQTESELKKYRISKDKLPAWMNEYNIVPSGSGVFKKSEVFFLKSLENTDYLIRFFEDRFKKSGFKKIDEMRIKKSIVLQFQKRSPEKKRVKYEIITVDMQNLSRGVLLRFGRSVAEYDIGQDVL